MKSEILKLLLSKNSEDCLQATTQISFVAEYRLSAEDRSELSRALLEKIASESNIEVRERMLFALMELVMYGFSGKVDFKIIVRLLPALSITSLLYAIAILGLSDNPLYKNDIAKYLTYDNEAVRQSASDALAELKGAKDEEV